MLACLGEVQRSGLARPITWWRIFEKLAPMIVSTDQHARSDEEKQDGEESFKPGNREAVGQLHSQWRREDAGADDAHQRREIDIAEGVFRQP